ncbi:DUF5994 family protein [Streptomyces justiciae]|uniref:DUF5994 family protein n=1 Tax=Streptomyces justiciae TaxID=2780140 RepID=A0ABU3LKD9_9ACTN|nr:DUF5994 family protein [Streptomyces justiciae]MDT7839714.1 DUF5994 family protein [Streptomyces justiciae]
MESSRTPAEDPPADAEHSYRMPLPRLALTPGVSHGPLDGAWWPRCDVLELELPSLAAALEPDRCSTVGVTVDAAQWPDAPHTVMAPGRVITVEPTRSAGEEHVITLDCDTVGRWVLLVVPPQEPADEASRLMAAAADPALHLDASAILTR